MRWNENEVERTARCFAAIAHPLRLAILCALQESPKSVNELWEIVGSSQPNISRQLGILFSRQMVSFKKEGNRVIYSISSPVVARILDSIGMLYCKK